MAEATDRDGPPDEGGGAPSRFRGYELLGFQRRAIAALAEGKNVLVSAPTGAGKTLVAEYAIREAVRKGRRAIYTAPIKALSNQKYRDFREDPELAVGILTGDVTIHPRAQVLVMTTEILRNAIFEDPRSLEDVDIVVFDEVHYLDDSERGTVWEESLIFAPPGMRFLCLSATVSNVHQIGEWLAEIRPQPIEIVESIRRPVPLTFRLYDARHGAFDPKHLGRLRRAGGVGEPRRGRHRRARRPVRSGPDRGMRPPPIGPLIDILERRELLPALVFCFSRRDCERLARQSRGRSFLSPEESERMEALQEELLERFQLPRRWLDGEILSLARLGVAFHHAGMLPIAKELVERMFTSGLLRLLFTTETFALGINMPARTVVFYSLKKFDGVQFDYMTTRDFMQMAGRAGRQGMDEEGLVYAMLAPRDLVEAPLRRLLAGRPEAVESRFRLSYSSILHLVAGLGRERVVEAWEKSFDQFQHRESTRKERERARRRVRRRLEAHLAFLEELGYLRGDEILPRGKLARLVPGFELMITEMLYRGLLETVPPRALATVFVGLVHSERRGGPPPRVPAKLYGDLRRSIDLLARDLQVRARPHDLVDTIRPPSWGMTEATLTWYDGATFEELAERFDAREGDLVRTLRMAIQLLRQTRRAIDPEWDLSERLGEAMHRLCRDEVDARRQLELG